MIFKRQFYLQELISAEGNALNKGNENFGA
jgi:hypothetical protein